MATSTGINTAIWSARLGKNGPRVPRLAFGLLSASLTVDGNTIPDKDRFTLLDEAYRTGQTFWDTSDHYGDSEELVGAWLAANPDKRAEIFLCTKFGMVLNARKPGGPGIGPHGIDSSPDYCLYAVEKSLKRLGVSHIDLLTVGRLDKITPVEKTIEAMKRLVEDGKVRYIGLSEVSASTLRRAHAVHPIMAIQMEYSPACLDVEGPETDILKTARELGVAITAYSPLARGLLSGAIRSRADFSHPGDHRASLPWLNEENLPGNLAIVSQIETVAVKKGVKLAQLTLAWLLKQGEDIFPIPGTSSTERLAENVASLDVELTDEEDEMIRTLGGEITGERFHKLLDWAYVDTPTL